MRAPWPKGLDWRVVLFELKHRFRVRMSGEAVWLPLGCYIKLGGKGIRPVITEDLMCNCLNQRSCPIVYREGGLFSC